MNNHLEELKIGGRPMKKWEIEIQELRKIIELQSKELNNTYEELRNQDKEIERLKNNWKELRKWIVNNKHNENTEERYLVVDYGTLLGKMSELKGDDKE